MPTEQHQRRKHAEAGKKPAPRRADMAGAEDCQVSLSHQSLSRQVFVGFDNELHGKVQIRVHRTQMQSIYGSWN